MARRLSSQAVSLAPWSRGRVSSTNTWRTRPCSKPRRMTPRAVPIPAVARPPVLQWVSTASPLCEEPGPVAGHGLAEGHILLEDGLRLPHQVRQPAAAQQHPIHAVQGPGQVHGRGPGLPQHGRSLPELWPHRPRPSRSAPGTSAAATPMRGAPRTARRWMCWIMASGRPASSHSSRSGSRVWSRIQSLDPSLRKAVDSSRFTEHSLNESGDPAWCGPPGGRSIRKHPWRKCPPVPRRT